MATKRKPPSKRPLPTMKNVCDVAYPLRELLADTDWKLERKEIELKLIQLDESASELPFAPKGRKPSLEYKLARAAAEAILPHCHALARFLSHEASASLGSHGDEAKAKELAVNLSAALGVFVALAYGL